MIVLLGAKHTAKPEQGAHRRIGVERLGIDREQARRTRIQRGKLGRAEEVDFPRFRTAQLVAHENARKIRSRCRGTELAHESARAHAEEVMQQPAELPRARPPSYRSKIEWSCSLRPRPIC